MPSLSFSTFAVGELSTSAIFAGVASLVLFAVVGLIAGPNLEKFEEE
ncbi:hypothetical protein [Prochlorococcus sp. MIT 1223]|nr:hypothetical protein [Prochlorococcus sp. MIT 1223]